jgi:hypothetical protein
MESNHPKKALQTFPWPLGFRAIKSKRVLLPAMIIYRKANSNPRSMHA